MTMASLTKAGRHKTMKQLFCSAELTGGVYLQLTGVTVFGIIFPLLKPSRAPRGAFTFIRRSNRCLAVSDLDVGLFSESLAVIYWLSVVYERWGI